MDMKELATAMGNLEEKKILGWVDQFLAGNPSTEHLNEAIKACQDGMSEVGNRFESGEYFLAELIFAAEILQQVMERFRPLIKAGSGTRLGRVVLGTADGDLHDIGKNIVRDMLEAAGFEVHDLGINVAVQRFVTAVKEIKPQIVGISGLLTLALDSMKNTVDALKEAGVRDDVKVIIGGNPVTGKVCQRVGADAFTRSAAEGVEICKKWVVS